MIEYIRAKLVAFHATFKKEPHDMYELNEIKVLVQTYLDQYLKSRVFREYIAPMDEDFVESELVDMIEHKGMRFHDQLFRFIDEKGYQEVEVYKKSGMDRRLFSKIRSNSDYSPKKDTVFALSIGLELNIDEAKKLMETAGYTISNSSERDLIIRYFIENQYYNLYLINQMLIRFHQPVLGTK